MGVSTSTTLDKPTKEFSDLNRFEKIVWALLIPALYVHFTQTPKLIAELFPIGQNLEGIASMAQQSRQPARITVKYPDGRVEVYERKGNALYLVPNRTIE